MECNHFTFLLILRCTYPDGFEFVLCSCDSAQTSLKLSLRVDGLFVAEIFAQLQSSLLKSSQTNIRSIFSSITSFQRAIVCICLCLRHKEVASAESTAALRFSSLMNSITLSLSCCNMILSPMRSSGMSGRRRGPGGGLVRKRFGLRGFCDFGGPQRTLDPAYRGVLRGSEAAKACCLMTWVFGRCT